MTKEQYSAAYQIQEGKVKLADEYLRLKSMFPVFNQSVYFKEAVDKLEKVAEEIFNEENEKLDKAFDSI